MLVGYCMWFGGFFNLNGMTGDSVDIHVFIPYFVMTITIISSAKSGFPCYNCRHKQPLAWQMFTDLYQVITFVFQCVCWARRLDRCHQEMMKSWKKAHKDLLDVYASVRSSNGIIIMAVDRLCCGSGRNQGDIAEERGNRERIEKHYWKIVCLSS